MDDVLTVPEALRLQARLRPDSMAVWVDGQSRTWKELEAEVGVAAKSLALDFGVNRGDHVAILMENSIDWVVWALAAALNGSPIVPLNTKLGPSELAYQIDHSRSVVIVIRPETEIERNLKRAVVSDGHVSSEFASLRAIILTEPLGTLWPSELPSKLGERSHTSHGAVDADDILMIQYTSGTTAFPKGVVLTHGQVMLNARGVAQRLGLTEDDRICSPNPFFHVAGTTLLLFLGLVSGGTVFSFSRFEPSRVVQAIERYRVTVYNGVESFFLGLARDPAFSVSRVESIRTGWIAASPDLVAQVHKELGMEGIVNVYGLSEAAPNVTLSSPAAPRSERLTCGKPHSGGQVRIVDERGEDPLPVGVTGLIEVRGPCVMRGYYRDPSATDAVFREDGWLRTGDRGVIDDDGNLTYLGRAKEMIRVGGENVAPAEVEAALLSHPSISEVAVVAGHHETLIEVPVAFVVVAPGSSVTPQEVTDYVAARVASFKVPRRVILLDELPSTGSGKVQKYVLVDRLKSTGT